jgi:hypothetical protein
MRPISPLTNYYAFCVLPTVFRAFLRPLAAANSARAAIVARGVDMDDVEMPRREPNLRTDCQTSPMEPRFWWLHAKDDMRVHRA